MSCSMKEDSGKIKIYSDFASNYVKARTVRVWTPPDYDPSKKYAVLYMHDGQMLFDSTITWNKQEWAVDEEMSALHIDGKIKPTIVVGIDNISEIRYTDYFPEKPFNSIPDSFLSEMDNMKYHGGASLLSYEIMSDEYLKFIVEELKPFIDKNYSTQSDAENTFIMGSSMGGLISMYAICEYPEVFGGAACLSTHWPGIFRNENNPIPGLFIQYLKENLPDPDSHKIYFDYGTETLDSLYEVHQLKVDKVMKAGGYKPHNWMSIRFPGADHSENAWSDRLSVPLRFLLK